MNRKTGHKETLKGSITNITYISQERWAVFTLRQDTKDITCTGTLPAQADIRQYITGEGRYVKDKKYGKQFKFDVITLALPASENDMAYKNLLLTIPGIGGIMANKLIREHGGALKVWNIIKEDPAGLGLAWKPERLQAMQDYVRTLTVVEFGVHAKNVMYCKKLGLTAYELNKICIKYENIDIEAVIFAQNPYRMIRDIDGFGFIKVDAMALKSGVAQGSASRIYEAIKFVLESSELNGGNIYLFGGELIRKVRELLQASVMRLKMPLDDVDTGRIKECVQNIRSDGDVVLIKNKTKKTMIFSKKLLGAEKVIEGVVMAVGMVG